jgi:hypothetical protein
MKPLVLTEWLMPDFVENDLADLVLNFVFLISCGDHSPRQINSQTIWALARTTTSGSWEAHTGRTGGPTGAKTESIVIEAWLNFASNTKPSNYGSTCGRVRS